MSTSPPTTFFVYPLSPGGSRDSQILMKSTESLAGPPGLNPKYIISTKFIEMYLPVNLNTRGCCGQGEVGGEGGGVTFSYLILSGFRTLPVFAIFFNRFGMSIRKGDGYLS